jgi:hypothetical protein
MMTEAELDDWIVEKTDTEIVMSKMRDNGYSLSGLSRVYYVNRLIAEGYTPESAFHEVRHSLMRLLHANRLFPSSINGWTTFEGQSATPERITDAQAVRRGDRVFTYDLAGDSP